MGSLPVWPDPDVRDRLRHFGLWRLCSLTLPWCHGPSLHAWNRPHYLLPDRPELKHPTPSSPLRPPSPPPPSSRSSRPWHAPLLSPQGTPTEWEPQVVRVQPASKGLTGLAKVSRDGGGRGLAPRAGPAGRGVPDTPGASPPLPADVDECATGGRCQHGECANTHGGYTCVCPDGFLLDSSRSSCICEPPRGAEAGSLAPLCPQTYPSTSWTFPFPKHPQIRQDSQVSHYSHLRLSGPSSAISKNPMLSPDPQPSFSSSRAPNPFTSPHQNFFRPRDPSRTVSFRFSDLS